VTVETASKELLREAKRHGTSDEQLAQIWRTTSASVRLQRARYGVTPVFKRVDTCAAEFESFTPYLYSTYEDEDESDAQARPKVMILGSGPNRIGQGIEFDYCCLPCLIRVARRRFRNHHGELQSGKLSRRTTTRPIASISSRSHWKMCLPSLNARNPQGVIVQFGGQTPLNLALETEAQRCTNYRHGAGIHRLGGGPPAVWAIA